MKKLLVFLAMVCLTVCLQTAVAQPQQPTDSMELVVNDTLEADSAMALMRWR